MILRDRTAIPRVIWALAWMAGTLGAVVLGGQMLAMHHIRRVVPADAAGSGRMPPGPSMYEMEGPRFLRSSCVHVSTSYSPLIHRLLGITREGAVTANAECTGCRS